MGNKDGEEDYEASSVDERGRSYPQNARTREDEDNCDRAEIEAQRGSHETEGNEIGCDVGRRSEETRGVKEADDGERSDHATGRRFIGELPALRNQ
jgi:hypothetical protein